jgi:undecaprenyl-diphosphatase
LNFLALIILTLLAPFSNVLPCFHLGPRALAEVVSVSLYIAVPLLPLALFFAGYPQWASVALALLATLAASLALKCLFHRPRPLTAPRDCDPATLGYPSAHSALATTLAEEASEVLPKVSSLAWGYALLVYWSRVELCKHYPLDIVGGILTSVAVLSLLQ